MSHKSCDVAIIGAGPYGLATASYLRAARVSHRVFGDTMAFWRGNMPSGMKLRSPWRASTIGDPHREHTLDVWASEHGIAQVENLPLTEFVRYGEWFQRRAVPDVDKRMVRSVGAGPAGFRLTLDDGDTFDAKRVVVAMGLTNQAFRPQVFESLPASLVSHSSEMVTPADYRGRKVAVVGRGQSACESAVLLAEAGAEVELISRGDVRWLGIEADHAGRSKAFKWWAHKVLTAPSAIGPFPFNWLVDAPGLLYAVPFEWRQAFSLRALRAAASGWLKERARDVRFNVGRSVQGARPHGSGIALSLDNGIKQFDHVLLATGYRTDVGRLGVLAPDLLQAVALSDNYPVLSRGLESSVRGLHFMGSPAVGSFGPLMRFVAGSDYAARSVANAVLAQAGRSVAHALPRPAMQAQQ